MKQLFYLLYAIIFHCCRLFPIQKNLVVFLSAHNANLADSLGAVYHALEERGGYRLHLITRLSPRSALRYFTIDIFLLATARYIFLNDNFMPMAYLHFSKQTVVTQLWHGEGAFKRYCLGQELPQKTRRMLLRCCARLSYVVCSGEEVVDSNAEAYHLPRERVLPLGSARTDYFFHPPNLAALREKLDTQFPQCRGKQLVLYAPTFRDAPERDKEILTHFDCSLFMERFGEEKQLLVRMHPQVHTAQGKLGGAVDVTAWPHVGELVLLADVLITDYSSICMDFSLLDKPCVFYAYDLEQYEKERAFYYPYRAFVPGPVAQSFSELLELFEQEQLPTDRLEAFRRLNLSASDGQVTQRVVSTIMKIKT